MAKFEYDYYSGERSEQFRFLKVPKVLYEDPDYENLGLEECTLYGILLEHMDYSKRNGWIDEEGRTYVIHSLDSIKKLIKAKSIDKARHALNNLIDYGLIEKKRRGQGKPDLIYVKDFATKKTEKAKSEKQGDCGKLFSENEKSVFLTKEKAISKDGEIPILEAGKSAPKETNNNYIKFNETPSIHLDTEHNYSRPIRITADDGLMDGGRHKSDYELYAELVRDNLDYDYKIQELKYDGDRKLFDDFYNLIVEILVGDAKKYKINGTVYPAEIVKSRMMKLTGDDVMMAMQQFSQVTDKIHNIRGYMIATLYNAPVTTQAFIENDVKYGTYGGGWADLDDNRQKAD